MVPLKVAKAFRAWISTRKGGKAASTWSFIEPHRDKDPGSCFVDAYADFVAVRFDGRDSPEARKDFRAKVHSLSRIAEAWVFTPIPGDDIPALEIHLQGDQIVLTTTDRLLKTPDKGAEKVVDAFYNSIQAREYRQAWDLLSTALQTRVWPDGFDKFENGYGTYQGHRSFQKATIESNTGSAKVDVLYEEDQCPPQVPAVHELASLKIKDSELIPSVLDRIKEVLLELGADSRKLEQIPIVRFFEADAMIAIPYLVGISAEVMAEAFPAAVTAQRFHRARRLYCVKSNGKWLINRIEPLVQTFHVPAVHEADD